MEAKLALSLLSSYLIGSIPFTQLLARAVRGVDLRQVGSRNVGGRNLTRQLGLGWGLLGGALDVAKGAGALWLAQRAGLDFGGLLLSGMAVVAGHNWPVWLRFHGGKGLLAALGAIAYLALPAAVAGLTLGGLVLLATRNVVFTTLAGLAAMLLSSLWLLPQPLQAIQFILALGLVVLLASLPDILNTLRTPDGVASYLREPDAVYKQEDHKNP